MKKCCFLILLVQGIHLNSQNITQTIKGTVLDKQSQAPLPGVIVQVLNTTPPLGAATGADGGFRIHQCADWPAAVVCETRWL
jgi:hypothetical protein